MKRLAIGSIAAIGFVVGGAFPAQAGEYNGKGEPLDTGARNASSLCAFSGRDLPDADEALLDPENRPDDMVTGGHVQNYGQYVSFGWKSVVPSPGVLCRGNLFH